MNQIEFVIAIMCYTDSRMFTLLTICNCHVGERNFGEIIYWLIVGTRTVEDELWCAIITCTMIIENACIGSIFCISSGTHSRMNLSKIQVNIICFDLGYYAYFPLKYVVKIIIFVVAILFVFISI